ncbi:hypothetical protein L227DRAFT_268731 [Lentinus tigrinus ALCF2SS1-6]|uniref:Uncharacterized protein n=1 Tax=Lentinus tigrinus ALCF2SS1-6 TaxID=1328759 RepID=A0A5C2SLX5_9APHY|nr:hypothetical protein L227DRAFT_268731 [Lentinus tigrinus ALCF2SS1-6]
MVRHGSAHPLQAPWTGTVLSGSGLPSGSSRWDPRRLCPRCPAFDERSTRSPHPRPPDKDRTQPSLLPPPTPEDIARSPVRQAARSPEPSEAAAYPIPQLENTAQGMRNTITRTNTPAAHGSWAYNSNERLHRTDERMHSRTTPNERWILSSTSPQALSTCLSLQPPALRLHLLRPTATPQQLCFHLPPPGAPPPAPTDDPSRESRCAAEDGA